MFSDSATARSRAPKGLGAGLVVSVLGVFFLLFWWTILLGIVGVVLIGVGLFVMAMSLGWLIVGGRWDIRVDDSEVSWGAPKVSEGSFRDRLDQVAFVERRIRTQKRKNGRTKVKTRYTLHGPADARHSLSAQSGVDVEAFVSALEARGVSVRETHTS